MSVWRIGRPSDKQRQFFLARSRFVAYGGARGGGKSWAVRKKAAGLAIRYPGIRILLLRRTFPELRENHILPMRADLAGTALYRDSDKSFTFPTGSRILFGYCDGEADVLRYQGQEFDAIFLDEATQFTEFQFSTLTACLRGANPFPKRFYLTCNPGGVGHGWVKRLFIDRQYRPGERAEDYTFIPATVYDNAVLLQSDPDYLRTLKALPERQRRAWLDGCWDLFEGQYFPEFDRAVHLVRPFANTRSSVGGMSASTTAWTCWPPTGSRWTRRARAVVYREVYEGRDNGKGEDGRGHIISARPPGCGRPPGRSRSRPGSPRPTCGTAGRRPAAAPPSCSGRGGHPPHRDRQRPAGRLDGGAGVAGPPPLPRRGAAPAAADLSLLREPDPHPAGAAPRRAPARGRRPHPPRADPRARRAAGASAAGGSTPPRAAGPPAAICCGTASRCRPPPPPPPRWERGSRCG